MMKHGSFDSLTSINSLGSMGSLSSMPGLGSAAMNSFGRASTSGAMHSEACASASFDSGRMMGSTGVGVLPRPGEGAPQNFNSWASGTSSGGRNRSQSSPNILRSTGKRHGVLGAAPPGAFSDDMDEAMAPPARTVSAHAQEANGGRSKQKMGSGLLSWGRRSRGGGRKRTGSMNSRSNMSTDQMMDEEDRAELDKVAQVQASLRLSMGGGDSGGDGTNWPEADIGMQDGADSTEAAAAASQWPIFCDVCDSPITLDNWYHKRGDQYDLCTADFRAVADHMKYMYVLVHDTVDLGAERGPYEDAFLAHAQGLEKTQEAMMGAQPGAAPMEGGGMAAAPMAGGGMASAAHGAAHMAGLHSRDRDLASPRSLASIGSLGSLGSLDSGGLGSGGYEL